MIKIEILQIGDSLPAPDFQILARPNDWGKNMKKVATQRLRESELLYHRLWSEFKEYASSNNVKYSLRTPRYQHWYNISVGSSQCHIALTAIARNTSLECKMYIDNNHKLYEYLSEYKDEINQQLEQNVNWSFVEGRKSQYIMVTHQFKSLEESNKEQYLSWMLNIANKFYDTFTPYLKKVK